MKKLVVFSAALCLCASLFAQGPKESHIKWYGFIRNYYAIDSRESVAGTEDFFYYLPKDYSYGTDFDAAKTDLNDHSNARFAALTSRLGVDVSGYEIEGIKVGAKIETDFYNGLSGSTGTAVLRLRQAFATLTKEYENGSKLASKWGQAWHPMAADMPAVFSLNTGAPFGPFSRTPLVQFDYTSGKLTLTGASIWQMQYCSAGPAGKSANYVRNGGGELYLGVSYTDGPFLARLGANLLCLTPRTDNGTKKVDEHINTLSYFFYTQYNKGLFKAQFKSVLAEAGEHVNLNGGYGISGIDTEGNYTYTPTRNSSNWLSLSYGKKVQGILFAGYVKNFGTVDPLAGANRKADGFYFSGNSFANMNQMWRLTPTIIRNLGKVAFGLEWEITSVQYGDKSKGQNLQTGLYDEGLHWITNNRLQGMVKYTF